MGYRFSLNSVAQTNRVYKPWMRNFRVLRLYSDFDEGQEIIVHVSIEGLTILRAVIKVNNILLRISNVFWDKEAEKFIWFTENDDVQYKALYWSNSSVGHTKVKILGKIGELFVTKHDKREIEKALLRLLNVQDEQLLECWKRCYKSLQNKVNKCQKQLDYLLSEGSFYNMPKSITSKMRDDILEAKQKYPGIIKD